MTIFLVHHNVKLSSSAGRRYSPHSDSNNKTQRRRQKKKPTAQSPKTLNSCKFEVNEGQTCRDFVSHRTLLTSICASFLSHNTGNRKTGGTTKHDKSAVCCRELLLPSGTTCFQYIDLARGRSGAERHTIPLNLRQTLTIAIAEM